MTSLTVRSYAGEADLPRIVDLINLCEAVDQLDQGISLAEKRDEMREPSLDPLRDTRLWEDADGHLAAYGRMFIPPAGDELVGIIWARIHPEWRWEHGLETEIFGWAGERMREISRQRGIPAMLRAGSLGGNSRRITMLEQHGFRAARYLMDMTRSLADPLPEPVLPQGFTLRHLAGPEEVPAWVELFNQSFIDHWDHQQVTVEERLHWFSESHYRPEHDLIAVADDGTFAAFCKCLVNPEQNQRTGRQEGTISLLGTRRGYRKIGLGRAMVLAGLHRLKAEGLEVAKLGVDAESETGATRLYASLGFETQRTFIVFTKNV